MRERARWAVAASVMVVTLTAAPATAQFLGPGGTIPVVAALDGKNGTVWRSEVTVVNLGDTETTVTLRMLPEVAGDGTPVFTAEPVQVTLAAGEQRTFGNVVQNTFGVTRGKGGLQLFSDDGSPLAISSRTSNVFDSFAADDCSCPDDDCRVTGTFGQAVQGILAGGTAWVAGIREDAFFRTNVGILWQSNESGIVTVTIRDPDGEVVGSPIPVGFAAPGLRQIALDTFLDRPLPGGYVELTASEPVPFWAYASRVDNGTGDAVYLPARSRQGDVPF